MKKITIALLGMAGIVCLSTSAGLMMKNASAETVEQTHTVELSKTVYKVSKDNQKMLLVTAIKDFSLVYEIGYDFKGYTVGENDIAATNKYYDTLTTGGVMEDADDIFGVEWEGAKLLVWEVANTENVSFTAYAKEAVLKDDILVKPETEIKVLGTERNNAKYTVTYVNEDGSVLATEEVYNGKVPSYIGTPTQEATAQYTYEFNCWDKEFAPVTEDVTYTAMYTPTTREYTITFDVDGGSAVEAQVVLYGTPASALDPILTSKTGYKFVKWQVLYGENYIDIPNDAIVTGDMTVKAFWEVNKYNITFLNEDGTELQSSEVAYGEMPIYNGATPTKTGDAQYSYVFAGWGEIVAVTGEATYTATYTQVTNKYAVKFINADGTELQSGEVAYGEMPAYSGEPSMGANYQFIAWDQEIVAVTGEASYKATYKYLVKSEDDVFNIGTGVYADVYELQNNVEVKVPRNVNSGGESVINELKGVFNLNNHILSVTVQPAVAWDWSRFIHIIAPTGVLKNGKIMLNFIGMNQGQMYGVLADTVNGLVQDVEIYSTTSGANGGYWGIFGDKGAGTLENVVVRATGTTEADGPGALNRFGVFESAATRGSETIILKNCIFICEGHIELYTYEDWSTYITPSLDHYTNANNTNNIYLLGVDAYKTSGYNAESFDGNWKISAKTGLPYMVEDTLIKAEIKSAADFASVSGNSADVYELQNDVTVDLTDAYAVAVQRLASVLDLNGYTLTLNIAGHQASCNMFINELAASGVIKNGRIVVNYAAENNVSNGDIRGLIINKPDGLIQNVEINIAATGTAYGSYIGFFGLGNGTFENVVVNARGTSGCAAKHYRPLGIFMDYGVHEAISTITLKNCMFLTEGEIELITYETWDGVYVPTLESIFTNANNVNSVYATYGAYSEMSYNTDSYDGAIWAVANGIPSYKVK